MNSDGLTASLLVDDHMVCISLANSTNIDKHMKWIPHSDCKWRDSTQIRRLKEATNLIRESLTFHEGGVGAAVVVKVSAVRVVQAVVSQAVCVAQTLQDTIHETLEREQNRMFRFLEVDLVHS